MENPESATITGRSQPMTRSVVEEINHNRSTALERSVINYCGFLNGFYVRTTLALCSAVVHTHVSSSVRLKDFLLITEARFKTDASE